MSDPHAFLPYGRQSIDQSDLDAVVAALQSEYLTTGPRVEAFEHAFARQVGAPHAVACANGTAALHLAMMALEVRSGDVVVVPAITFVATANAVRYQGADVQFADVDPATGLLTPETLAQALDQASARFAGRPVRAVIPVHLAGRVCDLGNLADVAGRAGAVLVEDACHAVGSRSRIADEWRAVGGCDRSQMACFSFHPVKTLTTGEGGMVTTVDASLAERLRRARGHGLVREVSAFRDASSRRGPASNPLHVEQQSLGFNYRLPDILCALGLSQLARLDDFARRRAALAAHYDQALRQLTPRIEPVLTSADCDPVLHLQVVRIDFATLGLERAAVMQALKARGIGSQVHYPPVSDQPYYRDLYGEQDLPGARRYHQTCLSLPLYPDMTESDVERVVALLDEVTTR